MREPTDDTTPDEVGDSKPVSLFQPRQGRVDTKLSSSTLASSSVSVNSKAAGKQAEPAYKSTSSCSIISPIREEFDQVSVASSRKSPTTVKETTKTAKERTAAENMKGHVDDTNDEYVARDVVEAEAIAVANNYDSIPVLEQTKLPRGGVSVDTQAVGRVQVRYFCFLVLANAVFPVF